MARYTFPAYNNASTPRYVVVWDIHWHVMDCQRLEPATDLSGAMAATIERLTGEGWQAESGPEYGFVFIRRARRSAARVTQGARSAQIHGAIVQSVSWLYLTERNPRVMDHDWPSGTALPLNRVDHRKSMIHIGRGPDPALSNAYLRTLHIAHFELNVRYESGLAGAKFHALVFKIDWRRDQPPFNLRRECRALDAGGDAVELPPRFVTRLQSSAPVR